MPKRAILHIPHTEMLVLKPIQGWMDLFSDNRHARNSPTEVVLPGVTMGGPSFQSVVQPFPAYLEPPKNTRTGTYARPFKLFKDWIDECKSINKNCFVWGSINPVYSFLSAELARVSNQREATLDDNMCITNPVIQEMSDDFVAELSELGVDGVVFDLTDIYPQSGSNVSIGIDNTCFCPHCLNALEAEGFHGDFAIFLGEENPFKLVLQITETGVANMPVNLAWSASHLVKMSYERGFIKEKSSKEEEAATFLLDYIKARANVVAKSVKRLTHKAKEYEKMTAVIVGDDNIDLSCMTDIRTLQRHGSVGEFWTPIVNANYVGETKVKVCAYLWPRATYSVNAFFEIFERADAIVALEDVNSLLLQLQVRAKRLLANQLQPGNVYAVSKSSEFEGFVGVPLGREETIGLVQLLSQRIVGSVLPPDIINAMFGNTGSS